MISPLLTNKLAHTYSIVARDPHTGQLGVAVQSHWFSVGSVVPWAEPGVGAVATQALVEVSFGPRGLDLLRQGKTAQEALQALIDSDENQNIRQVAIVDVQGNVATHTGERCIPMAGHSSGEGFSAQANMMLNDTVWGAMAEAHQTHSDLPLAERLIEALKAAEAAGGDIRGRQSAALLVVTAKPSGKPWEDRLFDLRVEDHTDPVTELGRLLKVARAYDHMNQGDQAIEDGDTDAAFREYTTAAQMFPENAEMIFWHAVALANLGQVDESLPLFSKVFAMDVNWRELTRRLAPLGYIEVDGTALSRILALGE
ncbi:MAG: DUF1028 domain-containing protein [Chloroflexi bacterium]|nr:DUF1028 domain-containing protein [Chloroflexota bacterium]